MAKLLAFRSSDGDEIDLVVMAVPDEYSLDEALIEADVYECGTPELEWEDCIDDGTANRMGHYRPYVG